MAAEFKIDDIVWAKMKGFPPWPGKIVEPTTDVKKPSDKKPKHYVFFYGTQNCAWIMEELIWHYIEHRDKYKSVQRPSRSFLDAVEEADQVLNVQPVSTPASTAVKSPAAASSTARSRSVSLSSASSGQDMPLASMAKSINSSASNKEVQEIEKPTKSTKKTPKNSEAKGRPSKKEKKDEVEEQPAERKKRAAQTSSTPVPTKTRLLEKEPGTRYTSSLTDSFSTSYSYDFEKLSQPATSTNRSPPLAGGSSITEEEKRTLLSDQSFLPDVLTDTTFVSKKIIATPMKIGFIGLGLMGAGMVDNLLRSGHEVTVWNRTSSKCREFVKDGALKCSSPAEVVQSCDITFSCVSDQTALKDVVFGNCGILQGIGQGKGFVDMSTVDVETINDIAEAVTSRGGRFLEAPAFGNKQLAKNGQLVVMAAGDRSLYDDCNSCFQAMGRNTFFLGELGYATKMKLVLSFITGTTLAGLAEGMALAEKLGLNSAEMLNILSHTTVSSPFLRVKGTEMALSRISELSCKLLTLQKDLRLAINMSDNVDQPLHVGAAVNELFKKAKAKGYGEYDISAVYRAADM